MNKPLYQDAPAKACNIACLYMAYYMFLTENLYICGRGAVVSILQTEIFKKMEVLQ